MHGKSALHGNIFGATWTARDIHSVVPRLIEQAHDRFRIIEKEKVITRAMQQLAEKAAADASGTANKGIFSHGFF
jgi:hypothetical protein